MIFQKKTYQFYAAAILFFVCLVVSILFNQIALLAIPFVWISIPFLFNFCSKRTEDIFWLMILSLPLSTELNITTSLGIDFPDELLMMVLTGLAILKILHQPNWFPVNLYKEPLFLLLICIMGWTMITVFYANNSWLSFKFFLARIWFIIPFVFVPQFLLKSQTRIRKLALLLLVPMLLIVLQTLVRHGFFGFSFIDIKKTMFPFFRNHVNYSSMLVCLLVPAIAIYYLTPAENKNKKWLAVAIVVSLIAVFFSYSRGAWVALVVGFLVMLFIKWNQLKRISILAILIVVVACSWLFVDYHYIRYAPDHDHTIFHTEFSEHIAATVTMKDVSNAERFYRWVAGFRIFVEKPITGVGPNNFYTSYRPYTLNSFETWVSNNPEHSTIHNYFLLTLAEQGIVGLGLLLLLWFGMLFKLQYLYQKLQSQFYRTVTLTVAIIVGMIASINFMSDMIETDKIGSLFWLCLGFVFILNSKLQEELSSIA